MGEDLNQKKPKVTPPYSGTKHLLMGIPLILLSIILGLASDYGFKKLEKMGITFNTHGATPKQHTEGKENEQTIKEKQNRHCTCR